MLVFAENLKMFLVENAENLKMFQRKCRFLPKISKCFWWEMPKNSDCGEGDAHSPALEARGAEYGGEGVGCGGRHCYE